MNVRSKIFALAACLVGSTVASATQVYTLPPWTDRDTRTQEDLVAWQTEVGIIWAMNQPTCNELYRIYRSEGGWMSNRDFAYFFYTSSLRYMRDNPDAALRLSEREREIFGLKSSSSPTTRPASTEGGWMKTGASSYDMPTSYP